MLWRLLAVIINDDRGSYISHVFQISLAFGIAAGVRWTNVGWDVFAAEDIPQRHLQLHNLVTPHLLRNPAKIRMAPCVAGDLVTFCYHAPDYLVPTELWVVNGSLSEVNSRNEKGCLHIVILQLIENLFRKVIGAVVIGQRNIAFVDAVINVLVIAHGADQLSVDKPGIGTIGNDAGIAASESK
jgi:hypothetical protein